MRSLKNAGINKVHSHLARINAHVCTVRGSGLTVAIALHVMSVAVANPGEHIAVQDHTGGNDAALMELIVELRNCMHLEMIVDRHGCTIRTEPRGVRGEAPYVPR